MRLRDATRSRAGGATAIVLVALVAICLGGCRSSPPAPEPKNTGSRAPGPLPPVAAIVQAQNDRVKGLDALWARVSLRVDGTLANAKLNKEEAEGFLQVVLPDKVAVIINKLGNTYFYLGSNSELYWWFDLTGDKRAYFGRHAQATPETVDRFGIPVHPLDLIQLMAITPIASGDAPPKLHWSADGTLIWYDVPARGSTKRVLVDPKSLLPVMVELIDRTGKVVVRSELSKYIAFSSRSVRGANPSIPSRCIIKVPRQDLTITINLNDPAGSLPNGRPINPVAFNFSELYKRYPVTSLLDLDKREGADAGEPARPSEGAEK